MERSEWVGGWVGGDRQRWRDSDLDVSGSDFSYYLNSVCLRTARSTSRSSTSWSRTRALWSDTSSLGRTHR